MIKYYNSLGEYWKSIWVSRPTITKRYENWDTELRLVPKGVKYYEIDKEAVVKEYILRLTK